MFRRPFRFLVLIYILVGIYVAWVKDYINPAVIRIVVSGLLAIFLWPLVLLGVNLHIR